MSTAAAVASGREGRLERQLAVALRYDREREAAPRVVAKGKGLVAERIVALAIEHGVPRHRDDDLVRVLSKLEIDQAIPPQLYGAVAEVLAYVYRMNAAWAGHAGARRPVDV